MVQRKSKGSNAERELLHKLWELGFSVARVAGSGSSTLPSPDILALNKDKTLVLECKAWKGNYLHLDLKQMTELIDFSQRCNALVYVAWKMPHQGWKFLSPNQFNKSEKHYTISKKNAIATALTLEIVAGLQSRLTK